MSGCAVREVACQSILTRSRIPSLDFVVNPYVGCAHGCRYCYVPSMPWMAARQEEWGSYVEVKTNAAEVLARQLRRAPPGAVNLSTTTDPYQPAEARYRVTRACLRVLADAGRAVSILTKSPSVTADIDLLRRLAEVEVGVSIAGLDQGVLDIFEPAVPPVAARLEALARLAESGITTYAFCGPLLPFLTDAEDDIDRLFSALARVGVSAVIVDSMNLRGATLGRVCAALAALRPRLLPRYRTLSRERASYHEMLAARARRLAARHGLTARV